MSFESKPEMEQACVVPYRQGHAGTEVCLITSLKKQRWIFPKGIVEDEETVAEAALKEAWEEAGLRGTVGPVVDSYHRHKWGKQLNVQVMLMNVTETLQTWPEKAMRKRAWVSIDKARDRLSRNVHRDLLRHLEAVSGDEITSR